MRTGVLDRPFLLREENNNNKLIISQGAHYGAQTEWLSASQNCRLESALRYFSVCAKV